MIFTWVGANNGYILAQDKKGGSLETQTMKATDLSSTTIYLFHHEMW